MSDGIIKDLIFDIGLHKGLDAAFYLNKGFRVVALEAVPHLCETANILNQDAVLGNRLTIVQKALSDSEGQIVEFFVNPSKDDWGSLTRGAAEKGMGNAETISVETTTLESMFRTYDVPYYLKCDIEGADTVLVDQLLHVAGRPTFVSIEATCADDIAKLLACGYDRFQIVNQYLNPFVKCPIPAREGNYVDAAFTHETSGLFGLELPPHRWTTFADAMAMFQDWYGLRTRDESLAIGWLDVHVCKAAALNA
jgi:FkbM family methyltransferase